MSRKLEVLKWMSTRRTNSLFAAADQNNHDSCDARWHEGYAQAMKDANLQVQTIPEGER